MSNTKARWTVRKATATLWAVYDRLRNVKLYPYTSNRQQAAAKATALNTCLG